MGVGGVLVKSEEARGISEEGSRISVEVSCKSDEARKISEEESGISE